MGPISATPTLPLVLPQGEGAPLTGKVGEGAGIGAGAADKVAGEGGDLFGEMLSAAAATANQRINQGQAAGEAFAAGASDDIHGTMLALSQADIELKLVGAVRNKVIDAFYELWRMQI
ncbi:MAG TPA: flagellar hook-basal body complex protein FliE [Polyangiaceae bacterium]|nr:flagellar hook-basal body complex protein FliE [Polyangiaceae bacterium]